MSRREHRGLQARYLVALAYIHRLGEELAERGIPIPARPDGLDEEDEDDVTPVR